MSSARLAIAVVLILSFAQASTAQAGFAPANEEIAGGLQFAATGFASDAAGNSIIAWDEQPLPATPDEAKARRLSAGGTLGPVFDLAPGEIGSEPAAAMTASGRAFVAWEGQAKEGDPRSVKGRWIEPDGTLGPLLTIATGEAGVLNAVEVLVAVDPAGVATVCWKNEVGNVLGLRRVQPDGSMGTALPNASSGSVTNPRIAALPNGSTVIAWRGVEKVVVASDLTFGPPVKISETISAEDVDIAVDSLGNGLVVWRQSGVADYAVRGRRLDPTGAAVGTEELIDPPSALFLNGSVRVSADSAGDFLVTWGRRTAENDSVVFARGVNAGGVFSGPAQPLSTPLLVASAQQSALFDSGAGAAVWASRQGEVTTTLGRGFGAAAVPSGDIGELFFKGMINSVVSSPAAGVATFLTEYATSGASDAVVARRYLVPPACADSSLAMAKGRTIPVPLPCTGAAIEGAQVLEQPRHGTLGAIDLAGLTVAYTPNAGYEGSDSFTYTLSNDGGTSTPVTVRIEDRDRPRIKSIRLVRKLKRGKPAFKFRLVFSEPAKAVVRVKRVLPGGKAKASRLRSVGRVASKKASRKATIKVKGKLARRLAAGGRFRAIAVATDPARNRSKPKRIAFRLRG